MPPKGASQQRKKNLFWKPKLPKGAKSPLYFCWSSHPNCAVSKGETLRSAEGRRAEKEPAVMGGGHLGALLRGNIWIWFWKDQKLPLQTKGRREVISQQRKSFAQRHKTEIRWTSNSLVRKEHEEKTAVGRKVYQASPGQIDVKEHCVARQCQTVPCGLCWSTERNTEGHGGSGERPVGHGALKIPALR